MARDITAAIDGSHGRNAASLIWLNSFEGVIFFLCMIFMSFAATSFVIFVCGLSSGDSPKKKDSDSDSDDEPHGGEPLAEETLDAIEATTKAVWTPQVDPQQQQGDQQHGGGGTSAGGGGDGGSGINCGGGCGGVTCGAWGGHRGGQCVGCDRHWGR